MTKLKTLSSFALLALVVLVSSTAVLRASDAMKAIVGSYLEIQALLVTDKLEGIKPAATAIATRAEAMGASGAAMVKAAKSVADAGDLKAARDGFGPLSDAVVAAAKAEGWKDLDDVKLAYCPMVKQSWLQKGEKISNPYYGTAMSGCGEFKKP